MGRQQNGSIKFLTMSHWSPKLLLKYLRKPIVLSKFKRSRKSSNCLFIAQHDGLRCFHLNIMILSAEIQPNIKEQLIDNKYTALRGFFFDLADIKLKKLENQHEKYY